MSSGMSWYETFSGLWNDFIHSETERGKRLTELKEFLEEDIKQSKEIPTFIEDLSKANPSREVYNKDFPDDELFAFGSWITEHAAPIFENAGTDPGFVMIKWFGDIIPKKKYDQFDIEVTKIIVRLISCTPIVEQMCDATACQGKLELLMILHEHGIQSKYETSNAVDGNSIEVLKYLYYVKKSPYDSYLEMNFSVMDECTQKFIDEINDDWKQGIYICDVKPAKTKS